MAPGFEWFVAWRYLRERGRRAGLWPIGVALLLAVGAAVLFMLSVRTRPLHPADVALGVRDWKQIYQLAGVGAVALAVLVGVFGYLHTLQSIFTTISTYGVFLGTAALVIVLSVMNGFEVDLRKKILGSNAHVLVTKEEGAFTEWREIEAKLEGIPGLVAHTPYVSSEVVVAANSNYSGAIIKGIDPETVGRVTDLARNVKKGKLEHLWPILPDGGVSEQPAQPDAGPDAGDAGPDDEEPIDFSGGAGGEAVAAPADADAGADDAEIAGLAGDDEEPIDFSGGDGFDATPAVAGPLGGGGGDGGLTLPPGAVGSLDPMRPRKRRRNPEIDALDGILVGRELAKQLHLYVDQEVQVVSPLGQDTPQGQVPRVHRFRVAGEFFSGMYEYDTKFVYVTLPALQRFLSLGDEVNGIEIKVVDMDNTRPVVRAIAERLGPGYRVQDWQEINRNLFSALKLEKITMFLVLTIIILVASFSIISNLIMVVVEKGREIAILKSMGASDGGVMRVFMIEGLYIGMLGTAFGLTVGLGTCWALARFGLPLNPNVYYIDRLPVATDPVATVAVALAGVAISFIATVYPSYIAARLQPVDGLRYE